jgi:hypothetical protein
MKQMFLTLGLALALLPAAAAPAPAPRAPAAPAPAARAPAAPTPETNGQFWVACMVDYYGGTSNAVLTKAECDRVITTIFEANNVATKAFAQFSEDWKKSFLKDKKGKNDKNGALPKDFDRSLLNILLEKPGRQSVQFLGPFATRREALAAKAAQDAHADADQASQQEQSTRQTALLPEAARAGKEERQAHRSQQLALFLETAERLRVELHNQKGLKMDGRVLSIEAAAGRSLGTGDIKTMAKPPPSAATMTKPGS